MKEKKYRDKSLSFVETNENENRVIQNLWDTAKAVLQDKYTALQSYVKKKKSKMNNLTFYLKK